MSEATYEGKMPTIDDFCNPETQEEMFPGFPSFLFTEEDFIKAKRGFQFKCRCSNCNKEFYRSKGEIAKRIRTNQPNMYCNLHCSAIASHKAKLAKQRKDNTPLDYTCETCGKLVLGKDTYSSGRFCCKKCANAYSSKFGNTLEKREQKSKTLLKKSLEKDFKPCRKCGQLVECSKLANNVLCNNCRKSNNKTSKKRKTKREIKEYYTKIYNMMLSIYDTYNFKDMASFLKIRYRTLCKIASLFKLEPNPIFIPYTERYKIYYVKTILGKETSVTNIDFLIAKYRLEYHYYIQKLPASVILKMYNIAYSKFYSHLRTIFKITTRSNSEQAKNYYHSIGTYDNKTEKELYYLQCKFRFGKEVYSRLPGFELVKQYGWYKPAKNRWFGATRDHMVSRNYGWTHKIDPEIIRHPANCQIMLSTDNSSKGEKCTITLEELLDRIKHWED